MFEECFVPSSAPQLVQDYICITWEAFNPYYHIGMITVVMAFLFVAMPEDPDDPDNVEPVNLFIIPVIVPIIYFPLGWVYIFIVETLPIPEYVSGAHLYEAPVVLIPAIFLYGITRMVMKRYTGVINP